MTTPASNTPYPIITDAMQDAGLLQDGDDPTPEQLVKYMRRLRDVINEAQISGLKLWLLSDQAVTLVAGQATYSFKPSGDVNMTKPLRALQGYYLYTATNVRRPIWPLSWQEYLTLGQAGVLAGNQGPISQYFVNKLAAELQVTFWPCPDATEVANGSAHLLLQTQVTNPINLVETMMFPEEWRMFLHWGLANEICTGQPAQIVARCAQKAAIYRSTLEDWDVEEANIIMQVDTRSHANVGRFR